MITFLLLFMATILLFLGATLIQQNLFYSMIEKNDVNSHFLKNYGYIFLLLGLISVALIFVNQTVVTLFFIAVMMVVSALFSMQFSKKMH